MTMDQSIRNKLRNVVTQCRKLLEEAVSQVLQGQFGISASGKKDDVHVEDESSLKLTAEDQGCRRDLVAALGHIQALGYKAKDALAQLVREIAFTHLNRLCAYKMMEARAVWIGGKPFREAVSRGMKSQGFQFYLADDKHKEDKKLFDTGHQDVAYRHFLGWLGAVLSEEIGVLFSPTDPANRLWVPQRVLDDVLALLNSDDLKDIWSEDETIGWVYQYFTPKELRDQARKESTAPRNSYELAFRNQFFTPRYVVEFLTDNTLGRIWYEMRKGNTKLKEQCRYMVRRPGEVFLAEGQTPPEPTPNQEELSQEEILKQPVHIPHRVKKDPRELRILDPACGSGHFLLYCFVLLLTIYEEAYADPDLGPKLKEDYPTLEALRRDVPRLILAHNLHGIDIDLRCTQIAALALWLRCQRAYGEMGLKQDRPKITKSNIVSAEPMPGESEMLKEFVTDLQPKVLGHLVEIVFDKMKLAGEAGSLLKIEEELRDAIADAKKQWAAEHKQATDRKGRPLLFTRAEMERLANKTPQPQLFDFSEITDEQFWTEAESQVLSALRRYAAHASNGGKLQRQLFAEDAAQGFAFIDLCQRQFDVLLMNPPFGSPNLQGRSLLTKDYKDSKDDIDAAFVRRGSILLQHNGFLGVIANRTQFFKPALRDWREDLLLDSCPLVLAADLGYGVLDTALVEAAAYTVCKNPSIVGTPSCFFRLLKDQDKGPALLTLISGAKNAFTPDEEVFVNRLSTFLSLPESRIAYWAAPSLCSAFSRLPSLVSASGVPQFGVSTKDDFRFLRLAWEVPPSCITTSRAKCKSASSSDGDFTWVPFAKGGEYAPYFGDIHLLIDWTGEGKRLSEFLASRYPYLKGKTDWILHPESDYFKSGLTYTRRTTSGFSPRFLPAGCVFSEKGLSIFSVPAEAAGELLAILMSRVTAFFIEMMVEAGDAVSSGSAARTYELNVISSIPIPQVGETDAAELRRLAALMWTQLRDLDSRRETGRYFVSPFRGMTISTFGTLTEMAAKAEELADEVFGHVLEESWSIEKKVRQLFGLDDNALIQVDREIGVHPCSLLENNRFASDDELMRAMAATTEDIIDEEVEESGGSRAVTKKSYYVDRHIELLCNVFKVHPTSVIQAKHRLGVLSHNCVHRFCKDVVSYLVGVAVGRWHLQMGLNGLLKAGEPGPVDPLPISPPALRPFNSDDQSSAPVSGVIPDDLDHFEDIVRRVREVLELIWKDRAEAIEQEACEILGVSELRDYFRKPGKGGFWDDHVSRYSKSRRKAPIYWLLQSSKKSYALWVYYHRLDKDILFKARQNYVDPKIRLEQTRLDSLRSQKAALGTVAKSAKKIDKDIERQEALLSELKDFAEKLERAAKLNFGNPEKLNSEVVYDPRAIAP